MTEPAERPGRRSRPATLRRRIGVSFATAGVVLILLTATVVLSAVRFVSAGNRVVYRWDPAVIATQRLLTDLVEQETGLRGYALSSDAAFLGPYVVGDASYVDEVVAAVGAVFKDIRPAASMLIVKMIEEAMKIEIEVTARIGAAKS